ncbi:MAG: secretin N-terminal domain-containing protein [Candidatus Omnitrophota bacterium]
MRGYEVGKKIIHLIFAFLFFVFCTAGAFAAENAPAGELPVKKEPVGELPAQKEPVVELPAEKEPYVEPGFVTVNFKDADIKAVLNYLSEVSGVDIVTAPDVTGTVTLKLKDKPWEVALNTIVKNYGYAYEREGNIIRVVTLGSLQKAELSTEVLRLNYATAENANKAVKDMLTERGKVTFDTRTNTLIITDLPTNTYQIKQVMQQLDKKTPQIMIEARILETLLEKDEKMGIDWSIKIAAIGASRPTTFPFANNTWRGILPHTLERFFPYGQTNTADTVAGSGGAVESSTISEFPGVGEEGPTIFPFVDASQFTYGTLDFSQFSAVLELLKQRRSTNVVSNPRITTLNHKEAKILVGRVYNFPTFDQTELTGQWVITGYEAKELGIKLLVTPHVNEKGEIVVELKPEIKNYLGLETISAELKAPLWSTREADTQVMVKDGNTIFIGGLISENNVDTENKVPLLGDIFGDVPFLGRLFKSTGTKREKKELIFFITVHIVKDSQSLLEFIQRGLTEGSIPKDIMDESESAAALNNEVVVELPIPAKTPEPIKIQKPLFDFRKKKK